MILTTTPSVQGHDIIEYKEIVFGEVITGVNFIKDFGAGNGKSCKKHRCQRYCRH